MNIEVGGTVKYKNHRARVTGANGDMYCIMYIGRSKWVHVSVLSEYTSRPIDLSLKTGKKANGKRVVDRGDATALRLRAAGNLGEMYQICEEAGLPDVARLRKEYADKNPGMQRMIMGNRLRAFLRRKK